MAWQSMSFRRPRQAAKTADTRKIVESADKHRPAMEKIVQDARELAKDRRETLNKIEDPQLRRSAAR
jgi:hypothetical protein